MRHNQKTTFLRPIPLLVGSGLLGLPLAYLFWDRAAILLARRLSGGLIKELSENASDHFLDTLLVGMDLMFSLSKSYRRNLKNFQGTYLFQLRRGDARTGVEFKNENMKVFSEGMPVVPEATIVFEDFPSLAGYLLSKDEDLLKSLLENKIEIDGNLNLMLKFCFMVNDLKRMLGVGPS